MAKCSMNEIVFDPSSSTAAQNPPRSAASKLANEFAHTATIEQAHRTIEQWTEKIKDEYYRSATLRNATSEELATIKSYTTAQLQRLLTFVAREDTWTMSLAAKQICATYLNLRAAPGVNDIVLRNWNIKYSQAIERICHHFHEPSGKSSVPTNCATLTLHQFYFFLRGAIDSQPELKQSDIIDAFDYKYRLISKHQY
ncbi:MAG: hypothetical protein Q9188_005627 [Gyalolechia gomerana]